MVYAPQSADQTLSGASTQHAQACTADIQTMTAQLTAQAVLIAALQAQVAALVTATGSTWYNGSGLPSDTLGKNGDYYLDVDTANVYTKENGTWV